MPDELKERSEVLRRIGLSRLKQGIDITQTLPSNELPPTPEDKCMFKKMAEDPESTTGADLTQRCGDCRGYNLSCDCYKTSPESKPE